jgi:hypothetical protein
MTGGGHAHKRAFDKRERQRIANAPVHLPSFILIWGTTLKRIQLFFLIIYRWLYQDQKNDNTMIPNRLRPRAIFKTFRPFLSPSTIPTFYAPSHTHHTRIHAFSASTPCQKRTSDPLRILFCGSDAFSCESLKALHREHVANKALIESLEVMVLPGKRTGRGLKQIRQGESFTKTKKENF